MKEELVCVFYQAEDGIRDRSPSRGLGMCIRDSLIASRYVMDSEYHSVVQPSADQGSAL